MKVLQYTKVNSVIASIYFSDMYGHLQVIHSSFLAILLMGVIKFLIFVNTINKAFDILSIIVILSNLYPALHLHITVIVTS